MKAADGDYDFSEIQKDYFALAKATGAGGTPDVEHEPDTVPTVLIDAARFFVTKIRKDKEVLVEEVAKEIDYVEFVAAVFTGGWRADSDVLVQVSRALATATRVRSRAVGFKAHCEYLVAQVDQLLAAMDHALRSAHRDGQHLTYNTPQITLSTNLLEIGQGRVDDAVRDIDQRLDELNDMDGLNDDPGKDIA